MCRYDEAPRLLWWNVRFLEDGSEFEISSEKRKNAKFRQGNKVTIASSLYFHYSMPGADSTRFEEVQRRVGGPDGFP